MNISFTIDPTQDSIEIAPDIVVIAGFTGRDQEAVAVHLAELRALGVPTPGSTPCYYHAPPSSLIQSDSMTVVTGATSGEAECVLIRHEGADYLTLGSDHTDRAAEAIDIPLSKLACPKPIARHAWRLADIEGHLDRIEMRSWISDDDGEHLYQEGVVGEFMAPGEIFAGVPLRRTPRSVVLFCGTLPAIDGIRPARHFRAELRDPITGSILELAYSTIVADYVAV